MRIPHRRTATAAVVVTLAVAAGTVPGATAAPASSDDHVRHVVAISIDGLNPNAIRKLGPNKTPNLHRMLRHGAGTLNARTVHESTSTIPSHTSMLTGRRVATRHGGHGVTFNRDNGSTVHDAAGEYTHSVYDVVHDAGRSTALYTTKDKFALFHRTWNEHGGPDTSGPDNGTSKIDTYRYAPAPSLVDELRTDLLNGAPAFTLLHLAAPDKVGHDKGFMSPAYLRVVRRTDRHIGTVLDTIANRPTLAQHTIVILTSDHGGRGRHHSNPAKLANYRIPFIVWGPGVARGANLYRLNPDYANPGPRRPAYQATRQPIRNAAVPNLTTDLLDLPKVPASTVNLRHPLEVFR